MDKVPYCFWGIKQKQDATSDNYPDSEFRVLDFGAWGWGLVRAFRGVLELQGLKSAVL